MECISDEYELHKKYKICTKCKESENFVLLNTDNFACVCNFGFYKNDGECMSCPENCINGCGVDSSENVTCGEALCTDGKTWTLAADKWKCKKCSDVYDFCEICDNNGCMRCVELYEWN